MLTKANLTEVGVTVIKVARDIREQNRSEWSPEARRAALRDLDEAIGEFTGMRSFLAEFSEGRKPIAPKFVGLMKKISYRSVVAVGATAIMGVSAKAARLFGAGEEATKAIDAVKDKVVEASGEVESLDSPCSDTEST